MEIEENTSASMTEVQNEIIEEFSFLGDDRESTIFYIMELGQKLPELDEKYRIDENIIKGVGNVLTRCDTFKETEWNIFQWSITDELRRSMGKK